MDLLTTYQLLYTSEKVISAGYKSADSLSRLAYVRADTAYHQQLRRANVATGRADTAEALQTPVAAQRDRAVGKTRVGRGLRRFRNRVLAPVGGVWVVVEVLKLIL